MTSGFTRPLLSAVTRKTSRFRKLIRRHFANSIPQHFETLEKRYLLSVSANISGPSTGVEQTPYVLTLSATSDGTLTGWTVDWGDGSANTYDGDATSASHTYVESSTDYTISATVTDSEPDSSCGCDSCGCDSGYITLSDSQSLDISVDPSVEALCAVASSSSEIDLNWTLNAQDATSIEVDRSSDGSTFTDLANLSGTTTSYSDTGLPEDNIYYYMVRAIQPAGDSNYTTETSATTNLLSPSNLRTTSTSSSEVNLAWSNNSSYATSFQIDRSTDGTNFSMLDNVGASSTTYSDISASLSDETSYTYQVIALDDSGNASLPSTPLVVSTPLAQPTDIHVVSSASGMVLTWLSGSNSAVGYNIYKSNSPGGPWNKLNSSLFTGTTYTDTTTLATGFSYYEVKAVDGAGTESDPLKGHTPRRVALFNSSTGTWSVDSNGNGTWEPAGGDSTLSFGAVGDMPVTGNWTGGAGQRQIGTFTPTNGAWKLDTNGNGQWDNGVDTSYTFGQSGDQPVVGNWNGGSQTELGVFRQSQMAFYLDMNGNGQWDGSSTDTYLPISGLSASDSYIPIAGDWFDTGTASVGLFDSTTATFYLFDTTGNLVSSFQLNHMSGTPVVGDWLGNGTDDVGLWDPSNSTFYLDTNADQAVQNPFAFGALGNYPASL